MPDSSTETSTLLRRARICTSAIFFLDGFVFANWVSRIPAVQEQLQLRNAALGVALLMMSLGALFTMALVGRLTARWGSRAIATFTMAFFAAGLLLPGVAVGVVSLSIALLLFGAGFGGINVATNAQAVSVERRYGRPLMGSFHACFSFGGIAGAIAGGAAAALHVTPWINFGVVALVALLLTPILGHFLIPDGEHATPTANERPRQRNRGLMLLGVIAFCTLMGEGAMADWSAVFLKQVSNTTAPVAAMGFAAFSLAMTLGRLVADRMTVLLGPVRLVRLGGSLAAAGLLLAMLLPSTSTAIAGFTLVGAGLSALVPTLFSAAGRTPGVAPSVAIAAVSTTGYFGFLCGPPLIGLASELVSLRWAIALVFTAAIVVIALARHVGNRQQENHIPAEIPANAAAEPVAA